MVNIGQMWNGRHRQEPRRHDHSHHGVGQPDILPAPGGHALHGQYKAPIQDATEQHPSHTRNGNRAHGCSPTRLSRIRLSTAASRSIPESAHPGRLGSQLELYSAAERYPPSTTWAIPVTPSLSSETRYNAPRAMSSGVRKRPTG